MADPGGPRGHGPRPIVANFFGKPKKDRVWFSSTKSDPKVGADKVFFRKQFVAPNHYFFILMCKSILFNILMKINLNIIDNDN